MQCIFSAREGFSVLVQIGFVRLGEWLLAWAHVLSLFRGKKSQAAIVADLSDGFWKVFGGDL